MRFLISLACLALCLQACGGTSVALFVQWGDCDFDRGRWEHADERGRGCMLASLIDRHPPESMTTAEVMALLGKPTGYADHDEDPAYFIAPASGVSGRGGEQLLVYRSDRRSGRILGAELIAPP